MTELRCNLCEADPLHHPQPRCIKREDSPPRFWVPVLWPSSACSLTSAQSSGGANLKQVFPAAPEHDGTPWVGSGTSGSGPSLRTEAEFRLGQGL